MVAQVLLAAFFAGVAVAGLRGWGVDTRDVRFAASWPARSRAPPAAHDPHAGTHQEKGPPQ